MGSLNYTNYGFNTDSGANHGGAVTGSMTTMATNDYIYALRFNKDEYFHDISQTYQWMSHMKNAWRPFVTSEFSLFRFIIRDLLQMSLTYESTYTYSEFGKISQDNYTMLGNYHSTTTTNVGDSAEYTVTTSTPANQALNQNLPRIGSPLIFTNHNLKIADSGDTGAAWTGHTAIGRDRYTRYTPFNHPVDYKGYESGTDHGGEWFGQYDIIGSVQGGVYTTASARWNKGVTSNITVANGNAFNSLGSDGASAKGVHFAVWNPAKPPRLLGRCTANTSTTLTFGGGTKSDINIGDRIYALTAAVYNYFHPNRIISMVSNNSHNTYGLIGTNSTSYRTTSNNVHGASTNIVASVSFGVGPFASGHFVSLADIEPNIGSQISDYTAGASFCLNTIYNNNYTTGAGVDGMSDQVADTYPDSGTNYPQEGWSKLSFRGYDGDFVRYNYEGRTNNIEYNALNGYFAFKHIIELNTQHSPLSAVITTHK